MAKWQLVPPENNYWTPVNKGFNNSNAKFVCSCCRLEFPLEFCKDCGASRYQLGTSTFSGLFCEQCEMGSYVWDCPSCTHREKTIFALYYDSSQLIIRKKRFWE